MSSLDPAPKKVTHDFHEASERRRLDHLFQKDLLLLNDWMHRLSDPEKGAVGQALIDAFAKTGCTEKMHPDLSFNAVFNSFVYPPAEGEKSFRNEIAYGPVALEELTTLFAARCHEYIHALQYHAARILHADPFNAETDCFVGPEDYLIRKERVEQDAYAKGAWLCSLLAETHPEIVAAMAHVTLTVENFQKLREESSDLEETLAKAAEKAGDTLGHWIKGIDHPIRTKDAWHAHALAEYKNILETRLKEGKPIAFIKMTDEDILAVGDAFGPNPFAANGKLRPTFERKLDLSPENRKELKSLEEMIKNRPPSKPLAPIFKP